MNEDQVWKKLSPGQRSLAQDISRAALYGAGFEETLSVAREGHAARAVAFKLWFLIWVGAPRRDDSWTHTWPTTPGCYWFWNPESPRPTPQPAEAFLAGQGKHQHIVYVRSNEFMYQGEYPNASWHPMEKPPEPPEDNS